MMGSMSKASVLLLLLLSLAFVASSVCADEVPEAVEEEAGVEKDLDGRPQVNLELKVVEFTVNFSVQTKKPTARDTYKKFIEGLRPRLKARFSHGVPVLPRQMNPPTRWFDILLLTDHHRITVRIRRDNLYLDGYKMENNQWWEFGNSNSSPPPQHLIPGSNFLGFKGDYTALIDAVGGRDTSMATVKLGQQALITAVNTLAASADRHERAKSLIVVIIMVCESIRFKKITTYFVANYSTDSPPPSWMMPLINNWGALSDELLHMDLDANYKFRTITYDGNKIQTAQEAVAVLGILLATRNPPRINDEHLFLPQLLLEAQLPEAF